MPSAAIDTLSMSSSCEYCAITRRSKMRYSSNRGSSGNCSDCAASRMIRHSDCGPSGMRSASNAGAPAITPKRWPSRCNVRLARDSWRTAMSRSNVSSSIWVSSTRLRFWKRGEARLGSCLGYLRRSPAERCEVGFQPHHETRHQVRTIQLQRAQRQHVLGLQRRTAGVVGEPEQLLLEVVEHRGELALQLIRCRIEHMLEHAPRPARQDGGRQGLREAGIKSGRQYRHGSDARLALIPI